MRYGTIYPAHLPRVSVVRRNKFPGCWQIKDKKSSPLTIDYYLLKHNSVTIYIYIYIYIYKMWKLCFYLLHLRDGEIRYILWYTIFRNFSRRCFPSSRRFFSSFFFLLGIDIEYLLSSNPKDIYLYREYP